MRETAPGFGIETLDRAATQGATSHVFGDIEVIQLRDGRLFRVCTESEAVTSYPKRGCDAAPRPLRPVTIIDA